MKKLFVCTMIFVSLQVATWAHGKDTRPFAVLRSIECKMTPQKQEKPSAPHIRIKDSTSENWSGYVAATSLQNPKVGTVTMVSGTWTVPHIASSKKDTYASIWVGIDGYTSATVEQIGTEHDWSNGKEKHYAWFEMFPKYPHVIEGFPVEPGDVISAEVSYVGDDTFKMVLNNHTKNVTTTIPTSHTQASGTKRSSAEWIVEAPATVSGVLPLADFIKTGMTDCKTTINGTTGAINKTSWKSDKLDMATKGGSTKALTSSTSDNGQGFSVTWKNK